MKIDGQISNSAALVAFIAILVIGGNWVLMRWNPRPPTSRYRKDGGPGFVAFWNMFDESIFTAEAIEYHRKLFRALPVALVAMVALWLAFDLFW